MVNIHTTFDSPTGEIAGLVRNLERVAGIPETPDRAQRQRATSGLQIRRNPRVPVLRRIGTGSE